MLVRGGVTSRLDTNLIRNALRCGGSQLHFSSRPRELVPGLEGRHRTHRFSIKEDTETPKSQRTAGGQRIRRLSTIPSNYFQKSKCQAYLDDIETYYSNCSGDSADNSLSAAPEADNVHLAEGLRLVEIDLEREMFRTLHAHNCGRFGAKLIFTRDDPDHGFGMIDYMTCTGCLSHWVYKTYHEGKSEVVAGGRKYSRRDAPTMNMAVVEAFTDTGIWPTALYKAFAKCGCNEPALKCCKQMEWKDRSAVLKTGSECIAANRKEAVAASVEQIEFDDHDGHHSASVLTIAQDGTGPKRFYLCRCTGTGHMQVALCKETGQIIAIRCDQTSCVNCSRAWGKAVSEAKEKGVEISPGSVCVEHDGMCYATSVNSPSVAEEYAAEEIGKDLLTTPDGKVRSDDTAIFIGKGVSDGDSEGVKRASKAQENIIGESATAWQSFFQDWSHVKKNIGKVLFEAAKQLGYGGKRVGLTAQRIKAIEHDIEDCVRRYKGRALDPANVSESEKEGHVEVFMQELAAIIPHHCGDHEHCTLDMCKVMRLQRDNPDLTDDELEALYDASARFKGKILSVDDEGVSELTSFITSRITRKNADAVGAMESTGKIESSNAQSVSLTSGKRLNMTQTNAYIIVWNRVVGHQRMGPEFELVQMELLGVGNTPLRKKKLRELANRLSFDRKRKQTPLYSEKKKLSRIERLASEAERTKGKSSHRYRKDKDKSGGGAALSGKPRQIHCGACGQAGHRRTRCKSFPYSKNQKGEKLSGTGTSKKRKRSGGKPKKKIISIADVTQYEAAVYRMIENAK